MDRSQQLDVYRAQTINLRTMGRAWTNTKRAINRDLVLNNVVSANLHTKLLALIYSAWSESGFLKAIHTPYGFELDEIRQIKTVWKHNGITAAWNKAAMLAFRKVRTRGGNYVPNASLAVDRLVKQYIEKPSQIRNKVAHGQWDIALNSKNSATNSDLTKSLNELDVVSLDCLREGCIGLCTILESLIESPDKAFHKDYWECISAIEAHLEKTAKYTLAEKLSKLRRRRPAPGSPGC